MNSIKNRLLTGPARAQCLSLEFKCTCRALYVWLCATLVRYKYYVGWYLSEGGCLASGFGFEGNDTEGKPKW